MSPTPSPRAGALAKELLAESREELARADGKASILFAIAGIVIAAVITGIIAGTWKPSALPALPEATWWCGAALVIASVVLLGAAVYPNLGRNGSAGRVTYFEHVRSYADRATLIAALEREANSDSERAIEQLEVISDLVHRKYVLIQIALWALAAGALACLVSVAAS